MINKCESQSAFTIVELLVVIVVIGILAAITIVSYSGIRQKANLAALQSDLKNASTQLEIAHTQNDSYPANLFEANLKSSSDTIYDSYTLINGNYCLQATNNDVIYHIDSISKTITEGICLNSDDWIVIGTQTWARKNLNVGDRVANTTEQINNSVVEKYCYDNLEANCTTYGGLYQWDEAMQYVTTEGTRGICPAGSHIPTDTQWKTLEMFLGMTQVQADATGWRGTDQGTQLKVGGSSGINIPLGGLRSIDTNFTSINSLGFTWSSSEINASSVWDRYFSSSETTVRRTNGDKANGLSVRCLLDYK